MEAAAIVLPMIAGGVGAVGTLMEGDYAKASGDFQAKQLKQRASEEMTIAGAKAADTARQAKLANSRNLAVAAASGAGASDPTVLQIMGDTEAQGVHNSLTELYSGLSKKADLLSEADAAKIGGVNSQKAGYIGAAGTLLQGFSSGAANYARMK